ncbi:MAG: hypothetical protein EOP49_15425 [Sphingobacteriales bacterium]|nr:MAG: hypothetical protein EOP49_15425 [Sphingobacteriales bacterium]
MSARKRLRRFATVSALLVALVVLTFLGYVKYQQHDSYQTLIPKTTTALVRVDVYALYRCMLGETFGTKKKSGKNRLKGIAIPANIFCYTVAGKQPGTWFTSLPISSFEQWEKSLRETLYLVQKHKQPGIHFAASKDSRWTIAYDKTNIAMAYSTGKEPVEDQLQKILQHRDMVAVSKSVFHSISNQDGHITFVSGKASGSIVFETGSVIAQATCDATGFVMPGEVRHQQGDNKTALNFWLFGNFENVLQGKTFTIDTFHFYGDSLLATQPKGLELTVTEPQIQRDSIVSYEYNDDFEKVATATVKEQTVPGLNLRLYADATSLNALLQHDHIVVADSQLVNRSLFPLYQLHVSSFAEGMQFSTVKQPAVPATVNSKDFVGLAINFDLLRVQEPFSYVRTYLEPFRVLTMSGSVKAGAQVSIEARLDFKDASRSSLAQLLDFL